jgi:Tat protein secretion system quality control protein TatD with DNase activity
MLHYTAEKMAEVLGMSKEEVIRLTEANAKAFYSID